MPRLPVPCRSCGKPCHLGGQSKRRDPLCIECYLQQFGRDPRGRPRNRPELACSGCGKRMSYGGKGKPAVVPMCLECRRARPGYHGRYAAPTELRMITCEICGQQAPATTNRDSGSQRQKTCGRDECRKEIRRRKSARYREPGAKGYRDRYPIWVLDCLECGKPFVSRWKDAARCSDRCRRKYDSRMTSEAIMRRYREDPEFRDLVLSRAHNRRADKLGQEGITSPATLIAYLMERDHGRCGKCHKPIRAKKGPRRPSIGHIIPLSRGGEHKLTNLQAEHLDCNLSANAHGDGGQLLLVG